MSLFCVVELSGPSARQNCCSQFYVNALSKFAPCTFLLTLPALGLMLVAVLAGKSMYIPVSVFSFHVTKRSGMQKVLLLLMCCTMPMMTKCMWIARGLVSHW